MNNKMYSVEFSPSELEQLLKVLYEQTAITDDAAIGLIAKINSEVHSQSPLNLNSQDSPPHHAFNSLKMTAAETYYRYRVNRVNSVEDLPPESEHPEESSSVLARVVEALEAIMAHLSLGNPEPLGFLSRSPQMVWYREAETEPYWYQVNGQKQWVPITAETLTCRVQSIALVQEKSGKVKVHLSVQGDKLYRLNIPCNTVFCKTLILGLANLSAAQLRSPITIEPVRAPGQSFVTCKLYQQGVALEYTTPADPHWPSIIEQLQQTLAEIPKVS